MLKSYSAILFDFDFTLGDSSRGIVESINYALSGTGYQPAGNDDIHKLIGHTLRSIYTDLTHSSDDQQYARFRDLFNERAEQVVTPSTILYPGVVDLLTSLRDQNKTLGIISTKYRKRLEEILHKFKVADYFTVVIGGEDVKNHKPHPEGLYLALERLSLAPAQAIYVGDTVLDAEAAQASGVDFAAVLTGTTPLETFTPFSPVGIYNCVYDLL